METRSRVMFGGWLLASSAPAWAKGPPGIEPTVYVLSVAAAFAAGVAIGYVAAKSGSKSDEDNK